MDWISCKERLPKEAELVLVKSISEQRYQVYLKGKYWIYKSGLRAAMLSPEDFWKLKE